jgi:predicted AlkP superfamily phosphohydrolase/phosphomutase
VARAKALGIERCEKVLLYAPDAVGLHLCEAFPDVIRPVAQEASVVVRMKSVVPPVTPVCFSTMFTGHPPAVHGIRKYEKPVLTCETLFDRLVSAGKRVAIVTVRDSSIDRLFRERAVDYFSERYDPEVTETTLRLLKANQHDVVLAYHQEYDDTLHRTTPRSEDAIEAMRRHVASFVRLSQAVEQSWGSQHRMLGFVPDHGGHIDPDTGKGTHGLDMPEDMDVQHYYGVFRGRAAKC